MSDATNVIEAIRCVMRDLPGIGKGQTADPRQGGYSYRGIEDITPETKPLFAKHGVVFIPHVRRWEIRDIEVNGKPWTDTILEVEYTVYGPGGVEDHIPVGPVLGIGRDNSDKGANKALTQAYKYAMVQALNIADPRDDGDRDTHVADRRMSSAGASPAVAAGRREPASPSTPTHRRLRAADEGAVTQGGPPQPSALHEALTAKIKGLDDDQKGKLREFCGENGVPLVVKNMSPEQVSVVLDFLRGWEVIAQQFPGVEYDPDDPERPM